MLELYKTTKFDEQASLEKSHQLLSTFKTRRTIRHFSQRTFDSQIIINAIKIAALAPNGANKQPWSFSLVSDPHLKRQIRLEAEQAEYNFYKVRKPKKWIDDLSPLHTDESKLFLTEAPYLLPIFAKPFEVLNGKKSTNYYVKESVGIACGFLISSLHQCGLSVLTYTPSKINFIHNLLGTWENEKLFMLLAIGLPSEEARVPSIDKKSITEILTMYTQDTHQ